MDYLQASDSKEVTNEKVKRAGIIYGVFFLSLWLGGKLGMGENSIYFGLFAVIITFLILIKMAFKEKEKAAKEGGV